MKNGFLLPKGDKMIGIIAAMDEEVSAVLKQMQDIKEQSIYDYVFYTGKLNNQNITITKSGVGKVQAAMATTIMLTNYPLKGIINVGIAGGLSPKLKVCDVVIADKVAQWDFDLTAFDYQKGFNNERYTFFANQNEVLQLKEKMKTDQHVFVGPMVTGDQFIYNQKLINEIKAAYPEALCADMEAGAIAQVAKYHHLPFLIIRSISDVTGDDGNENVFEDLIKSACQVAAEYCYLAVGILASL